MATDFFQKLLSLNTRKMKFKTMFMFHIIQFRYLIIREKDINVRTMTAKQKNFFIKGKIMREGQ